VDPASKVRGAISVTVGNEASLRVHYCQGLSPAGGAVVPVPPFKIGAPHFTFSPDCCIHPILYLKNVAPLLLNPGDGPDYCKRDEVYFTTLL